MEDQELERYLERYVRLPGAPLTPLTRGQEVVVPPSLHGGYGLRPPYWEDCFARAYWYLTEHADVHGILLAHGCTRPFPPDPGERLGHGWVELPKAMVEGRMRPVVFDGVACLFYTQESYYEEMQVSHVVRYTAAEAVHLRQTAVEEFWQPWPEYEGGRGEPPCRSPNTLIAS